MTEPDRSTKDAQDANDRAQLAQARGLPATAFWCAAAALVALGTSWHVHLTRTAREAGIGWSDAATAAPVCGVLALLLIAVAWWQPRSNAWGAVAALFAGIAAAVCWAGGTGVAGAHSDGPAPWLAGFGFATAAVGAGLASWHAQQLNRPEPPDEEEQADVTRRVRAALRRGRAAPSDPGAEPEGRG